MVAWQKVKQLLKRFLVVPGTNKTCELRNAWWMPLSDKNYWWSSYNHGQKCGDNSPKLTLSNLTILFFIWMKTPFSSVVTPLPPPNDVAKCFVGVICFQGEATFHEVRDENFHWGKKVLSRQVLFMTVGCMTAKQPSFTSFTHGFIQHHSI